jgi:hypothetical protein
MPHVAFTCQHFVERSTVTSLLVMRGTPLQLFNVAEPVAVNKVKSSSLSFVQVVPLHPHLRISYIAELQP